MGAEHGASLTPPALPSRTHSPSPGPSAERWPPLVRSSRGAARAGGRPVHPAGPRGPASPAGHMCPPGCHLRADGSMIYARAGAAKVSGRFAGTLLAAPSSALLWAASPLLARPRQRPPSPEPGIHPPPTFSRLPGASIVSLGRAAGPAGIRGRGPELSATGTPGPPGRGGSGRNKETPERVGSVSPAPALPVREVSVRGRRDLRNPLLCPHPPLCPSSGRRFRLGLPVGNRAPGRAPG